MKPGEGHIVVIPAKHGNDIAIAGIVLFALIAVFTGCGLDSPKAPSWDTVLEVPAISKTFDMREIVRRMNQSAIQFDSSGQLSLSFRQEIPPVAIASNLALPDTFGIDIHPLGNVRIALPRALGIVVDPANSFSPAPLAGQEIPAFPIKFAGELPSIKSLHSVTFGQGWLLLTLMNRSDFAIDSVVVVLEDISSGAELAAFRSSGTIDQRTIWRDSVDLAGRVFSNEISFEVSAHSLGGRYSGDQSKDLAIQLNFSDQTKISHGEAIVPRQSNSFAGSIKVAYPDRVESASIDSGMMDIRVANRTNFRTSATIAVAELRRDGNGFSMSAVIEPGAQADFRQDVSGWELAPTWSNDTMRASVLLTTGFGGEDTSLSIIDTSDAYEVTAALGGVRFDRVTGILAPRLMAIDSISRTLNLPEEFRGASFGNATAVMRFLSEADVVGLLDCNLIGSPRQSHRIQVSLVPGSCTTPGTTLAIEQNLQSLVSPLPERLTISGTLRIGDNISHGTVCRDSKMWGNIDITCPLVMTLDSTDFLTNINVTRIDQTTIRDISDRLLSGRLLATFVNHLPLGATVILYLSGDSASLGVSPESRIIGPFLIAAGKVDTSGLVRDSVVSKTEIVLSEEDLRMIRNPLLFVGGRIHFQGTAGQPVRISGSDSFGLKVGLSLSARMGK
jgi:hypothetical protein